MLLIRKNDLQIESSSRLVKAEDVAAIKTASEIIAAAEAEVEKLNVEAKEAFELERKKGYEKGLEEGRMQIAMDKLNICLESAAYMERVEGQLADVVIKALQKCVAQLGDRQIIMEIIRKLLKAVIHNQRHIALKVAPEMVQEVRSRINEVLIDYPMVEQVDVEEDPRLKGTAAIIETEAGIADASIETQLAAIENSIRKHFAKDRP